MAIAAAPHADMQHEVELVKASLLYADEVELISIGSQIFDGLRELSEDPIQRSLAIFLALDNQAIERMMGDSWQGSAAEYRKWMMDLLTLDPDKVELVTPGKGRRVRELQRLIIERGQPVETNIIAAIEASGVSEFAPAIQAGVLRLTDFRTPPAEQVPRPAEVDFKDGNGENLWKWIDVVADRLVDRNVRMLFDQQSGDLIGSMHRDGVLGSDEIGGRLAAQAALGAGFTARLPAFTGAKMDELLDLRKELSGPLIRYRGAVIAFSKSLPAMPIGSRDLGFEVQQLWESDVLPSISDLEEQLADHSLVRELWRTVRIGQVRNFGLWTAATWAAIGQATDLDTLTAGAVGAAATGVPGAAQMTLDALQGRGQVKESVEASKLYYLFDANRRLGR